MVMSEFSFSLYDSDCLITTIYGQTLLADVLDDMELLTGFHETRGYDPEYYCKFYRGLGLTTQYEIAYYVAIQMEELVDNLKDAGFTDDEIQEDYIPSETIDCFVETIQARYSN
jgi:hypothetical protein